MGILLKDILDLEIINSLLENYSKATGLVSSLLDLDGNILAKTGWQKICTDFHRINPESAQACRESDTVLANSHSGDTTYNVYKCRNGLIDISVPIIIEGEHLGNLFTGQFFFEPPEESFFKSQAEKFSFPEKEYIEALRTVPVLKENEIRDKLLFLSQMTTIIAEVGLSRVKEYRIQQKLKEREIELKTSEEKYRALVEQSITGIYIFNREKYIYVNNRFCEIFGYREEEIIGKLKPVEVVDENYRTLASSMIDKRLSGEIDNAHYFVRGKRKDNRELWIEIFGTHINLNGEELIAGTILDVTETHRKTLELEISEEKFRIFFEQNALGLAIIEIESGLIVECNDKAGNLLGLDPTPKNEASLYYIFPADAVSELKARSKAQKPGSENSFNFMCNIGEFVLETYVAHIRLENGNEEYRMIILEDITDQAKLLNEIESRKQVLQNQNNELTELILNGRLFAKDLLSSIEILLESCAKMTNSDLVGFWKIDRENSEMFCLDSYSRINSAHEKGAILTMTSDALNPRVEAKMLLPESLTEKVKNGNLIYEEVWIENGVGGILTLENKNRNSPWNEDDDRMAGYIATLISLSYEINRRKKAVKDLFNKNEEMEQLLFTTSHDLRSPLVNIQGFSKELSYSLKELEKTLSDQSIPDVIKDKCLDLMKKDIGESIGFILSSGSKMEKLLSGLLTISRLGRITIKNESIDMNRLIDSVLNEFSMAIVKKNITIVKESVPPCKGDEIQLNRVFSNLIGNSIKFLDPSRQGIIKIKGYREKKGSVYTIEDNGIGIPENHWHKVFSIFHKLHPEKDGQGIGLAVVKQIINKHNGRVEIESKVSEFTRFTIRIPEIPTNSEEFNEE